ncbi:unnamed protein product [Callosobruchus maculatus]|uniref:Uncharacterized protein n=1 Tax=Callosobruchus maculatus TaxID=64391 RepID=A0A653CB60_CALMS|nr:unnamed protein product [Callosobruchus maculatus]
MNLCWMNSAPRSTSKSGPGSRTYFIDAKRLSRTVGRKENWRLFVGKLGTPTRKVPLRQLISVFGIQSFPLFKFALLKSQL